MVHRTTKSVLGALALAGVLASTGLPRIAHAAALDGVQPLCAEYVHASPTSQSGRNPFYEHGSWGCNNTSIFILSISWGDGSSSSGDSYGCIFNCSSGGHDFGGHPYASVTTYTGKVDGEDSNGPLHSAAPFTITRTS